MSCKECLGFISTSDEVTITPCICHSWYSSSAVCFPHFLSLEISSKHGDCTSICPHNNSPIFAIFFLLNLRKISLTILSFISFENSLSLFGILFSFDTELEIVCYMYLDFLRFPYQFIPYLFTYQILRSKLN